MITNEVLEEVRATKAALSREAGGDVDSLCDLVDSGASRRERLMAEALAAAATLWLSPADDAVFVPATSGAGSLREDPPPYGEPET